MRAQTLVWQSRREPMPQFETQYASATPGFVSGEQVFVSAPD